MKVQDVTVDGVENWSEAEFLDECAKDDPMFTSFGGAHARGVAVVASRKVTLDNVRVSDVYS